MAYKSATSYLFVFMHCNCSMKLFLFYFNNCNFCYGDTVPLFVIPYSFWIFFLFYLFLLCCLLFWFRLASPRHGFTIMNRLSMDNLTEPITKDLDFQLQDPFLLYRNARCKSEKQKQMKNNTHISNFCLILSAFAVHDYS